MNIYNSQNAPLFRFNTGFEIVPLIKYPLLF